MKRFIEIECSFKNILSLMCKGVVHSWLFNEYNADEYMNSVHKGKSQNEAS